MMNFFQYKNKAINFITKGSSFILQKAAKSRNLILNFIH